MIRSVLAAVAVVVIAAGIYFLLSLFTRVEDQQVEIQRLQTELRDTHEQVEAARRTTLDNQALYELITNVAEVARVGSPLNRLRHDEKLRTLRLEDLKEIATLLNVHTPLDGPREVAQRFGLSEYQVRVLMHLLFIPDRLQKDAPGYPEFELQRLRDFILSASGLGPITLGMSLDEASERLKIDLRKTPFSYGDESCHSWALGSGENEWLARFITEAGKIGRIDIYGPGIATDKGIHIESSMRDAMNAYDSGKMFKAHDPSDRVWHVPLTDDTYLAFTGTFTEVGESWDDEDGPGRIRSISLGQHGVGSVEGCL